MAQATMQPVLEQPRRRLIAADQNTAVYATYGPASGPGAEPPQQAPTPRTAPQELISPFGSLSNRNYQRSLEVVPQQPQQQTNARGSSSQRQELPFSVAEILELQGSTILTAGTHKGLSFERCRREQSGYCNHIRSRTNMIDNNLISFQKYLQLWDSHLGSSKKTNASS